MSIETSKELAETCHAKGYGYTFYVHHCGCRGFLPMTEREFNEM